MLFALIFSRVQRACTFNISAERNVWLQSALGPVSRKSRNFSGVFRVIQFSLYLQNEGASRHETFPLSLFLFPLQHFKRSALQNKQVMILRMAFRARKVLGTFEKRAPGIVRDRLRLYGNSSLCDRLRSYGNQP